MDTGEGLAPQGVQWRLFVRALAEEVDSLAVAGERDDMLRGVGRRMARMAPMPAVATLDALEIEMNDTLALLGWGSVRLQMNAVDRALLIRHSGLPRIGSMGTPGTPWLAALLEGLYETWLAQQPGSQAALVARRVPEATGEAITLRFAKP